MSTFPVLDLHVGGFTLELIPGQARTLRLTFSDGGSPAAVPSGTWTLHTGFELADVSTGVVVGSALEIEVDGDTATSALAWQSFRIRLDGFDALGGDVRRGDPQTTPGDETVTVNLADGGSVEVTAVLSGAGGAGAVTSVNGQTGVVVLAKTDVGLGLVDNTSDASKPVSTAQAAADTAATNAAKSYADDIVSTEATARSSADATLTTAVASKAASTRSIATTAPLAGGGDLSADRTLSITAATTIAAGSMSAADKVKLDGVATGATASPSVSYATGDLLAPPFNMGGTQSIGSAAIYCQPVRIERTVSIDRLWADVTTGVASGTATIYLFPDVNGRPSTSTVTTSVSISTVSTGVILGTVSVTLTPGWYWLGVHTTSAGAASYRSSAGAGPPVPGMPQNSASSANTWGALFASAIGTSTLTGAPTVAGTNGGIRCGVRVA